MDSPRPRVLRSEVGNKVQCFVALHLLVRYGSTGDGLYLVTGGVHPKFPAMKWSSSQWDG
jgi:hypothetical protein